MAFKQIIFFTAFFAILFSAIDCYACRGPQSHSQTFLPNLPQNIEFEDLAAKVIIFSNEYDDKKHVRVSKVRVVEGIKQTERGQVLQVISQTHSCAQDWNVKLNQEYYIAGSLDKDGYFVGEWNGDPMFTHGQFTKK